MRIQVTQSPSKKWNRNSINSKKVKWYAKVLVSVFFFTLSFLRFRNELKHEVFSGNFIDLVTRLHLFVIFMNTFFFSSSFCCSFECCYERRTYFNNNLIFSFQFEFLIWIFRFRFHQFFKSSFCFFFNCGSAGTNVII